MNPFRCKCEIWARMIKVTQKERYRVKSILLHEMYKLYASPLNMEKRKLFLKKKKITKNPSFEQ